MVNILYGVSGEGSGHASRSKEIITALIKKHNVHVITYGKAYSYLKEYFPVTKIFGLHLAFKNNKITYVGTVKKNLKNLLGSLHHFGRVRRLVKTCKPDIIISDFEPTAYWIAKKHKLHLISLDNQHRITNLAVKVPPSLKKDFIICKKVIRCMIPRADYYLITSFFREKIIENNTFVFDPILRSEVRSLKSTKKGHVLVYQTSTSNRRVLDILQKIDKKFIVYGYNVDKKEMNLTFKKFSTKGFLQDLASANAVIANGGFTLMTEALFLKKPLLSEPIQGQFEQVMNADYLQKLNYGSYQKKLTKKSVELFLKNCKKYEKNLKKYKTKNADKLIKQIEKIIVKTC